MKLTIVALVAAAITALGPGDDRPRIDVTAVQTFRQHPQAPAGRAGDVAAVRWSLRDRYGRTIGAADLDCRWLRAERRLCLGELRLPLGNILVAGSSSTRNRGNLAVIGGTGRYERAGGVLSFTQTGIGRLTVTIVL